jgi:peptide methionine sulfoxide reductase msrA/msrB
MVMRELTAEEARVIVEKGTERPFSGRFYKHKANGTYTCRRCGGELFASDAKFDSGCGWPSFDEALPGAVEEVPDADGRRTEIICARCGGHLGHVFRGEGLTPKDTRHCVNSISLDFADAESVPPETAYFAGGCFWGVEYYLEQIPGVVDVVSGYMGGTTDTPSYEEVCSGETGHAEVVKVTYDAARSDFETVARLFFEIHDPTQVNRQGPDIGHQYRSAVFTVNDEQQRVARKLVSLLEGKGLKVATEIAPAATFYPAEGYHQNYYERTGKAPYCHTRVKRF